MMHDGWCPDCDQRSVVVDSGDGDDGSFAWATCSECGAGWVHRDELPVARAHGSDADRSASHREAARAA